MIGLSPKNGSTKRRALEVLRASDTLRMRLASSARSSTTRSAGSSTGFVRNCSAPSLIALTARSIVPWPVSSRTGSDGSWALSVRSTVEPVAVGQREVDDGGVHGLGAQHLAHRGDAVGVDVRVALAAEEAPQSEPHALVVVHQQDPALSHSRSLPVFRAAATP
jgi:hypothetical protein